MSAHGTAADEAVAIFLDGLACAPAVFAAFAPRYGLDREAALRIATPYGGGVAGCAETCGAVNGGILALGLARGRFRADQVRERDEAYRLTRRLRERFAARAGSLVCRELLAVDISTEQGMREAREHELFTRQCPAYVRLAADLVDGLLREER